MYFQPALAGDLAGLKQAGRQMSGIVVPGQTVVTSALLNCLPRLKVLDRMHAGTDNLDLDACKARGIKVIHASSASVRQCALERRVFTHRAVAAVPVWCGVNAGLLV